MACSRIFQAAKANPQGSGRGHLRNAFWFWVLLSDSLAMGETVYLLMYCALTGLELNHRCRYHQYRWITIGPIEFLTRMWVDDFNLKTRFLVGRRSNGEDKLCHTGFRIRVVCDHRADPANCNRQTSHGTYSATRC